MVSRIRGIGSFDPWEKLLVGGDRLLTFEIRPLIHANWAFDLEDLRALKTHEDGTINLWGRVCYCGH